MEIICDLFFLFFPLHIIKHTLYIWHQCCYWCLYKNAPNVFFLCCFFLFCSSSILFQQLSMRKKSQRCWMHSQSKEKQINSNASCFLLYLQLYHIYTDGIYAGQICIQHIKLVWNCQLNALLVCCCGANRGGPKEQVQVLHFFFT